MIKNLPAEVQSNLRSTVIINNYQKCVEELLVNSLDAGSSEIAVLIDSSEKCFIKVEDNGKSFKYDELFKVGERYLTSKNDESGEDQYGYKGESLASIIATCKSIEINCYTGAHKMIKSFKDGSLVSLKVYPMRRNDKGENQSISKKTVVSLTDLHHKTPMRWKAMDVINNEHESVLRAVESLALINHSVTFRFLSAETPKDPSQKYEWQSCPSVLDRFKEKLGDQDDMLLLENFEVRVKGASLGGCVGIRSQVGLRVEFLYFNRRQVPPGDGLLCLAHRKLSWIKTRDASTPFRDVCFLLNLRIRCEKFDQHQRYNALFDSCMEKLAAGVESKLLDLESKRSPDQLDLPLSSSSRSLLATRILEKLEKDDKVKRGNPIVASTDDGNSSQDPYSAVLLFPEAAPATRVGPSCKRASKSSKGLVEPARSPEVLNSSVLASNKKMEVEARKSTFTSLKDSSEPRKAQSLNPQSGTNVHDTLDYSETTDAFRSSAQSLKRDEDIFCKLCFKIATPCHLSAPLENEANGSAASGKTQSSPSSSVKKSCPAPSETPKVVGLTDVSTCDPNSLLPTNPHELRFFLRRFKRLSRSRKLAKKEDKKEELEEKESEKKEPEKKESEDIKPMDSNTGDFGEVYKMAFSKEMFTFMKVIGQVDDKFIACLTRNKGVHLVVLIDQHAADERVRLEELLEDIRVSSQSRDSCDLASNKEDDYSLKETEELKSKPCLPPVLMGLPVSVVTALESAESLRITSRNGLKFRMKTRGKGKVSRDMSHVIITDVPTCYDGDQTWLKELLFESLERGKQNPSKMLDPIFKKLCSIACHGAIKFGHGLSSPEMNTMVTRLGICNLPFQCAHGRPTTIPLLVMGGDQLKQYPPKTFCKNLLKLVVKCRKLQLH